MKFQIQVRGLWGGIAGDWRPAIGASDGDGAVASTFGSWDEAEEVLDRMQLAGLLPYSYLEPAGAELRIIDLDERAPRGPITSSGLMTPSGPIAPSGPMTPSGSIAPSGPVTVGVLEPDGSGQRAA